jgi:hypothetical protein
MISVSGPASENIEQVGQGHRVTRVSGVLALHWEYPYFIATIGDVERAFEFEILDQRWLNKHRSLMMANPVSIGEYVCVSGRGYENRTQLGPTGRSTFIFTKITHAVKVGAPEACRNSGTDKPALPSPRP